MSNQWNNLITKFHKQGKIVFLCRVSSGAKNSEIKEMMSDGSLKVRVKSIAEKGKANFNLRNILSQEFEVPMNNVKITTGHTSKLKKVVIIK
jgi:uncharacterized protein YggU (UPF0235/DUF167 family)